MQYLNGRVTIKVGDITKESVDAIVNAANSTLLGGGGVDGAIHRAGGPSILEECRELRRTRLRAGLPTGHAVITTGGDLPARFVIHTVGPVYGENVVAEAGLLGSCYTSSLRVAVQNGLTSIAFPAISTGIYGYPKPEAAKIASQAIADFLASNDQIDDVRLVFHTKDDADIFAAHQRFSG